MVKVKICGITNAADALAAVERGVEMIGFVFADSPRRISPAKAFAIASEIPPFVSRVGVFVDAEAERVRDIAQACALDVLQFHGSESPEYCRSFGMTTIKAFRVKDGTSLSGLTRYGDGPFLMDTYDKDLAGGTGETFDWELAVQPALYHKVILSGGLRPDNVGEAIRRVRPYAVDVSSGIESAPGKKDVQKLRAFMKAVREAGETS